MNKSPNWLHLLTEAMMEEDYATRLLGHEGVRVQLLMSRIDKHTMCLLNRHSQVAAVRRLEPSVSSSSP